MLACCSPPRAPGPERPRYHALRTWRLAGVVGAGAGSRELAGARRRPARRGLGCAQLIAGHPDHQLGGRAEQGSALSGRRRCAPHTATRRDALPNRAPPTLALDLITREKKKTGEKLLRIVSPGHASPPPPAAAAAATAQQPSSPLVRPNKALRAMGTTSRHIRCATAAALPLTRRASQPPRHRAAHLAAVAWPPCLRRVPPRQPPSLITISPEILQPNEPRSNFWVGIADVLHIMAERFMNTWEETPWRTLGGRRMRLKGSRWLDGIRGRRSRARPGDGNTDRARQPDQQAGRELRGNAPAI